MSLGKEDFWTELFELRYMIEGGFIGGDFNEIFNSQNRLICNRICPNMRRFGEWVTKFALVNVSLSNGVYT